VGYHVWESSLQNYSIKHNGINSSPQKSWDPLKPLTDFSPLTVQCSLKSFKVCLFRHPEPPGATIPFLQQDDPGWELEYEESDEESSLESNEDNAEWQQYNTGQGRLGRWDRWVRG